MRPLATFLVVHVFAEHPDGRLSVSYTRGGFRSLQGALGVAEAQASPGQHFEIRRVTQRAWEVWVTSGCGHVLPVQGEIVRRELKLPQAS